jgi:pSer/pThr/pTyr-binding forkhead associated (FHA) protein
MLDEPALPSEAELAALRQKYSAQQVVSLFGTFGLPVSDDSAIIRQLAERERPRRLQERGSPSQAVQKSAVAWLEAAQLLEVQATRRELLLIVQEALNQMLSFRLESKTRDRSLYTVELREQLKNAAQRGFNLSNEMAERFLAAFERGNGLRLNAKLPYNLQRMDVRAGATDTFTAPLPEPVGPPASANGAARQPSGMLPVEATSIQPPLSQYTEPLPVVRPKPPEPPQSAPAPVQPRKPSGPVLTPANANGKLLITSPGASSEFALEQDEVNIGRMPESDICLKADLRVSRNHAVIHRAPTAFILTDLNSGNGTFVNGTQIAAPTILQSGDLIRIGQTEIQFVLEPKTTLPPNSENNA